MMTIKIYLTITLYLIFSSLFIVAEEIELEQINVQAHSIHLEEDEVSYKTSYSTDTLAKHASGETLGDYLSHALGVESASYGPSVGRPTVRGMQGYRVGIAQGGITLNDLSAMSQDHAVGLNARMSEHIEMVKGPASLLYGSYSGGVIRTLAEEHRANLPKHGLSFDSVFSTNSNTGFGITSIKSAYGFDDYSVNLNYYRNSADTYSVQGKKIADSDTLSEQFHGVLGWKISPLDTLKFYADTMDKAYGIANRTQERTDILMHQNRYGVVVHHSSMGRFTNSITEYQYSDYRHFEREGGRNDGLFDQQQQSLSSQFDFEFTENTTGNFRLEWVGNELKVCHEHGKCQKFEEALRTTAQDGLSLLNYYTSTNIPYSHGHPMPNTNEQKILLAPNIKHYLNDTDEVSIASNLVLRSLSPEPSNIQETWLVPLSVDKDYYDKINDVAVSLSLGWWKSFGEKIETQTSLAYMNRLPSSQELLWNGFHHATESYILGNRDLDNESSFNLDIDALYKYNKRISSRFNVYYYNFKNYIYQSPLVSSNGEPELDPFHLSPVWKIEGKGAKIYGLGLEEKYKKIFGLHAFMFTAQFNLLVGKLKSGGYIPRMAPYNASFHFEYDFSQLHTEFIYKRVDKSRHIAQNETVTQGYNMFNLVANYHYKMGKGALKFWLKGDNLSDELARNHLSFLKDTAPLLGRNVTLGVEYTF